MTGLRPLRAKLWVPLGLWILLGALASGGPRSEPLDGFLGLGPWVSLLVVLVAVVLAPGYILWRFLGAGGSALPQAFGLGLAWLLPWAGTALLVHGGLAALCKILVVAQGILFVCFVIWEPPRRENPPPGRTDGWLGVGSVITVSGILAVPFLRGFSFGGDEWPIQYQLRFFLDGAPMKGPLDTALPGKFDVWNLSLALMVRLARINLVDAYRTFLSVALIAVAVLVFIELAEALFEDRNIALLALIFQTLYCFSDMATTGEGAGMRLFARLLEDKYASCLLFLPLAQGAFLRYLRSGSSAEALLCGFMSLAAVAVHPIAAVWLGLSLGGTLFLGFLAGRIRLRARTLARVALPLVIALALALWMRSLREASSFSLFDQRYSGYEGRENLVARQLWVVSRERGWYLAHPELLNHPLVVVSLLTALALAFRFKRSITNQFLAATSLLPVLLLYNPFTAPILGALVTPGILFRVLWVLPVGLTLGFLAHALVGRLRGWLGRLARGATVPEGGLALLIIVCVGAYLSANIEYSLWCLRFRNSISIGDGEREALEFAARLSGSVLAPRLAAVHLPAFASRVRPYPGLADLRSWNAAVLTECHRFHQAESIGPREVSILRALNIEFVMVRRDSRLEHALGAWPETFSPRFRGSQFAIFAVSQTALSLIPRA